MSAAARELPALVDVADVVSALGISPAQVRRPGARVTRWAEAIGAVLRSVRPWRCPHARRLRLGRSQWECLDCRCLGVETGL